MLYLMTNRINIIIIILLTIKIIPLKAKQHLTNTHSNGNAELYGNFSVIEFLKELEHSKPTYASILIMQNQNATISSIFYTHLIKIMKEKYNNDTAATGGQRGFSGLSEMPATTFVNSLMDSLQVPVLQLNELQSFYLKRQYSEHFLSIVYIDINIEGIQMTLNDHKGLLEKLSRNLLHMRTSKVMFLLNFPLVIKMDGYATAGAAATVDEDVIKGILVQLFQYCWQQKIINVVALLANYQTSKKFYSYTCFPDFQLESKTITFETKERHEIYPNRLRDLRGYNLSIITGSKIPRVIRYKTTKGEEIIGGFVGHFMRAFAKKHRCSLVEPLQLQPNQYVSEADLKNAVRNGTAEISLGIYPAVRPYNGATYPIYILNWCIMLPVEPNIPGFKFFTTVFKGEAYILVIVVVVIISMILSAALYLHGHPADVFDLVCHDNCLRGILSQSFSEIANPPAIIRFIYLKICVLGILLTTFYLAYFSTYVTRPPKEPFINSLDDVLRSNLKIVLWEFEYNTLMEFPGYKKYAPIFRVVKDHREVTDLRNAFNTKYGYGVSNLQWNIFKEQQKIFTTPLFRQSPNFCLLNTLPMSLAVHENSIYLPAVNRLILQTAQTGLLFHWINLGFFELIVAEKLQLKDLSAKEEFAAMTIDHLRYVLIFLSIMLVFVILVFLGELFIYYRKRVFSGLRNYIRRL